ncbi:MAG: DUF4349 domain-containing protein [Thaumarchaeota archaeon]|nr:DUF4349 domain-containing protein [Nitrososphaerota archaeon]
MPRARSLASRIVLVVLLSIVALGAGVGVLGSFEFGTFGSFTSAPASFSPNTGVVSTVTLSATTTLAVPQGSAPSSIFGVSLTPGGQDHGLVPPSTLVLNNGGTPAGAVGPNSQTSKSSALPGSGVEFFANLTIGVASPQTAVGKIEAIALEHGGYLAYSTVTNNSAYAIMRVPASDYQATLNEVQGIGNVSSLVTTSNDVSVRVTDLNATLQSLLSEKSSLLRLVNQSTSVNSTLQVEAQIQAIDAQINSIESQLLNTSRLVAYSTITVFLTRSTTKAPLSVTVTATPKSGSVPLDVTFHAIVRGGSYPYLIDYNFADGTTAQGELLIHEFPQGGDYNTTVTITDSAGNTVERSVMIRVSGPGAAEGLVQFLGVAGGLLVRVVEGIIEVAVIIIPIALVIALAVPVGRKFLKSDQKAPNAT